MVQGSDMDIVVIVDSSFPENLIRRLDEVIYLEKGKLLQSPHMKEEIDYIVKDMDKVAEQMRFDTFKSMVACKIMHEGAFLYGSEEMFLLVKKMLRENGVTEKIKDMEEQARIFREKADEYLVRDLINAVNGWSVDERYMLTLGRETILCEREVNRKAGFTKEDDRIPDFMKEEGLSPTGSVFDIPDDELENIFVE